jgi:hypothetical protein
MRAVTNSLLALLLLGALLWANCWSCPQLLLCQPDRDPSHECCKHPAGSQKGCASFGLQHFVKTDPAPKAQLQAAGPIYLVSRESMPVLVWRVTAVTPYSPPDLEVLNSSIRI